MMRLLRRIGGDRSCGQMVIMVCKNIRETICRTIVEKNNGVSGFYPGALFRNTSIRINVQRYVVRRNFVNNEF